MRLSHNEKVLVLLLVLILVFTAGCGCGETKMKGDGEDTIDEADTLELVDGEDLARDDLALEDIPEPEDVEYDDYEAADDVADEDEQVIENLRGTSWYGIDNGTGREAPERDYKMTEDYFNFMIETFPNMTFLSLPVAGYSIMPNITSGDYDTIDYGKLDLLKDFISWCEPLGIKVLISNYWETMDEAGLIAYWRFMANEFKDETTIAGFDLINEPWDDHHGREDLMDLYEDLIDEIRAIDGDRTCYVQSMYYHYETEEWRNVLETRPVNRDNVVYISHLYSNNWGTGEWYDNWTSPWIQYYLDHDYDRARNVLESTDEGYGGMYERFGFIKHELGYPVAITEVAFIDSEEGLRYGNDVLSILNEWGMDWTYHCWYTNVDRPMSLTYPDGTLRPQATVIQDNL